ncbi:ficolin-1-A-like [Hydractinia symbiolongicarpus]|uniref:ficolin-1-A-like n=1 Tax=Hydractinia symbiolongicarpus TaxID=13093 RepID=UPI00254A2D76|nr:ficolin-1-A-like [Hydractinia symbiolongicarpus]
MLCNLFHRENKEMFGFVLLFCFTSSVAIHFTCYRDEDNIMVELIGNQLRKDATAVDTVEVQNEDQCMDHCLYKGYCVSFNAIRNNDDVLEVTCELFNHTNHNRTLLTTDENSSYYEVRLMCRNCVNGSDENGCRCNCSIKRDCIEWLEAGFNKSGVYEININGQLTKVFCDMETEGGGWIKFQNRFDKSVDFNKHLNDYKEGFGDINGEFWLGLEKLHQLTETDNHLLYLKGVLKTGYTHIELYLNFKIANEANQYAISVTPLKCENQNKDWPCYLLKNACFNMFKRPICPDCLEGWWWSQCPCYDSVNSMRLTNFNSSLMLKRNKTIPDEST